MNLTASLLSGSYHTTIMTSFCIDLYFFEKFLLHRLRSKGSLNNLVLLDHTSYSRTLNFPIASRAGKDYTLWPVVMKKNTVFHPKIIFQLGQKKARVFIGSANITQPGYRSNLEVMDSFTCSIEESDERTLIQDVFAYIQDLLPEDNFHIQQAIKESPWIIEREEVRSKKLDVFLSSGQAKSASGRFQKSILHSFSSYIQNDSVAKIILLSPFWDSQCQALMFLHDLCTSAQFHIVVDKKTVSMNGEKLRECCQKIQENGGSVQFYQIPNNRYPHAKVIFAQGTKQHLLIGSANCSKSGLGLPTGRSFNAEACTYRQYEPQDPVEEVFFQDMLVKPIEIHDLQDCTLIKDDGEDGSQLFFEVGYFILRNARIFYYHPSLIPLNVSKYVVELYDQRHNLLLDNVKLQRGKPYLLDIPDVIAKRLDDFISVFSLVLVDTSTGQRSVQRILQHERELSKNCPTGKVSKIQQQIARLQAGEGNISMLLEPISQLVLTYDVDKKATQNLNTSYSSNRKTEEFERYVSYSDWVQNPNVQWKGHSNVRSLAESRLTMIVDYLQSVVTRNDGEENEDDDIEEENPNLIRRKINIPTNKVYALRKKIEKVHKGVQVACQKIDTLQQEYFVLMWSLGLITMYLSGKNTGFSNSIILHYSNRDDFCLLGYAQHTLRILCKKGIGSSLFIETLPVSDRASLSKDIFTPMCFFMTLSCLSLCLSKRSPSGEKYAMDIETYALNFYHRIAGNQSDDFLSDMEHNISEVLSYCGFKDMIPHSLRWHNWLVQESKRMTTVLEEGFGKLPLFHKKSNHRVLTKKGCVFYVVGRTGTQWKSNLYGSSIERRIFSAPALRIFPAHSYPQS